MPKACPASLAVGFRRDLQSNERVPTIGDRYLATIPHHRVVLLLLNHL
jgi:hypothetical protein